MDSRLAPVHLIWLKSAEALTKLFCTEDRNKVRPYVSLVSINFHFLLSNTQKKKGFCEGSLSKKLFQKKNQCYVSCDQWLEEMKSLKKNNFLMVFGLLILSFLEPKLERRNWLWLYPYKLLITNFKTNPKKCAQNIVH